VWVQEPDGKPGNDFIGLNHYARCSCRALLCTMHSDDHAMPARTSSCGFTVVANQQWLLPGARRAVVNWMLQPDKKGPEEGGLSQMVQSSLSHSSLII
jgi:hypothetical protein